MPTPTPDYTPQITLEGERVGEQVTFNWLAKGYKEPLQCTANHENVAQEGSKTVVSVAPYTMTIRCMGGYTGASAEKSVTL